MISVFNGNARRLGRGGSGEVFMQVTVGLREHLHLFKGARLAVFMAIALHSNEQGWSHPSAKLLKEETGLNKDTIFVALNDLCALEINGDRVLLRDSGKGRKNSSGTHVTNRYLIFPTADEVREHETPDAELPFEDDDLSPIMELPMSEKPDTAMSEKPDTAMSEKPDTAMSDFSDTKNNHVEEEPFLTRTNFNQTHTHVDAQPARVREANHEPPKAANPRNAGVCVIDKEFSEYKSRHSLDELLAYAEAERARGQPVRNPRGLAMELRRSGDADAFVEAFLRPPKILQLAREPCRVCGDVGVVKRETSSGEDRSLPCPNGCKQSEVAA